MNVAFPLRDGYFKPLQCTPADEQRWRAFVGDLVQRGLQEEAPYAASQYQRVDPAEWKLLRERDQLRVYRPRSSTAGRSEGNEQSVLSVGTIEGTLEDVIYGIHHVTTQDMRLTTSFLSDDALDSAVLHLFENGNEHDPYRSFAVKWRIIQTPAGGLVKNRDGCVLEYMGIDVDDRGQRYAFHISETLDHPMCPPFNPQCAIRAQAHVRTIYREVSPGRVGVFFRGDYALCGRIPGMLVRMSTVEIALSIGKSVECAEAKKLTAMALASSPELQSERRNASRAAQLQCSICQSKPGLLSRSMAPCQLCGNAACSKCRSRKYLLSDEKKIPVACCKQCIVAAKNLPVDPRLPLRVVSAARLRTSDELTGDDAMWERDLKSVEYTLSSRSQGAISLDSESSTGSVRSRKAMSVAQPHQSTMEADSFTAPTESSRGSITEIALLDDATVAAVSSRGRKPSAAVPAAAVNTPQAAGDQELWTQMNELRLAAERTYLIAQENDKLMRDVGAAPPQ